MVFNDDGTELWFTGTSNRTIKKITLATAYDYTTNVGTSTNTISTSDLESIQDPVMTMILHQEVLVSLLQDHMFMYLRKMELSRLNWTLLGILILIMLD